MTTILLDESMIKDFAEAKQVDGSELEYATKDGWRVVAILDGSKTTTEQEELRHNTENNYQQTEYLQKPFVVQEPNYFVVRFRDQVIEKLRERITQLEVAIKDAETKRHEAQKKADTYVREIGEQKAEGDRQRRRAEGAEERLAKVLEGNNKIEKDISKLRAAIGELKFKEIVEVE